MGLIKYRKKRNFFLTKEPPGIISKHNGKLQFVVQRHAASHLHFDLRLENQGVLKSWAVPKGISMDPLTKRLAIQVEDHPFDYKDFEGEIPQGNYGAGKVEIWDKGTYFPASCSKNLDDCISNALAKGHLEFFLQGKKLKGTFSLIRLKKGENQWLIIKKKDNFSGKEGSPIGQIDFQGAAEAALPAEVKPMLATPIEKPFDSPDWIFEVKWDGYRCLAQVKRGKVRLYSRNNLDQNERFMPVVKALEKITFDVLLDGEIVVLDRDGRSDFQMLQNYMKTKEGILFYYVFDLLYADKFDLRFLPLEKRRQILEKILPSFAPIRLSGYIKNEGVSFFRQAGKMGLEGIMAKNIHSKYLAGIRSKEWVKIKIQKRQEAVIAGFTEPRGGRKYLGALIVGLYEGNSLVYAGHVGGGFDSESLKSTQKMLLPLVRKASPFLDPPKTNMPVTWVEPKLVCEVKFSEWTKEHVMRHPVFLGLRQDKAPEEAIKEEPTILTGSEIEITNPEKLFWPEENLTKKDVIEYYQQVAGQILPFLKDRPQSLYRNPNGITQPGFFQKDYRQNLPEWVKTAKIYTEKEDKEIQYLLCQNKETLLFLANLGCIEINVWNSRVGNLDHPDYAVLDFDPVEITFDKVVIAVKTAKEVLDELKLSGFCKTSGARGIHVYIPVKPIYTYEQLKDFSRLICMAISKRNPEITSLERSPTKRKGLVYLDYLQNRMGATMASAYSLRPRPGATVSAPIEWDELPALDPRQFNIGTMLKRIKKQPNPWKNFFKVQADIKKSLPGLRKLVLPSKNE